MPNFYEDLLKDHNHRYTKHFISHTPAVLKVKSVPGNGVKLWHKFAVKKTIEDQQIQGSEDFKQVAHYHEKNEAKLKVHQGIYQWIADVKNKKFSLEVSAEPKDFNNDEKSLELKHESQYKTETEVYTTVNSLRFGSPKLGPLRLWIDLGHKWNSDKEQEIHNSLNVQIQDEYNVGYDIKHDTKKITAAEVQGVVSNEKGQFFLRGDLDSHLWTLGCHHWHKLRTHFHSYEFTYDVSKKTKGIRGQPLFIKFAGEYNLTPFVQFKTKWTVGHDLIAEYAWVQQVDDKLTIVASNELDVSNAIRDAKKLSLNWGVQFTYNL